MDLSLFLTHPLFSKWVRKLAPGQMLFQQGELGNTFYIVLEGQLRLLVEGGDSTHWVARIQAGEFLGEKALVRDTSHLRHFSAEADTAVVVAELGAVEIRELQAAAPELMLELLRRSFEVSAERLDRTNYLVRVLRSSNEESRFLQCLIYVARSLGDRTLAGVQIRFLADTLSYHLDRPVTAITLRLQDLVAQGVLVWLGGEEYLLPQESALLDLINELPQSPSEAA